jgi:hypothetical protein
MPLKLRAIIHPYISSSSFSTNKNEPQVKKVIHTHTVDYGWSFVCRWWNENVLFYFRLVLVVHGTYKR